MCPNPKGNGWGVFHGSAVEKTPQNVIPRDVPYLVILWVGYVGSSFAPGGVLWGCSQDLAVTGGPRWLHTAWHTGWAGLEAGRAPVSMGSNIWYVAAAPP